MDKTRPCFRFKKAHLLAQTVLLFSILLTSYNHSLFGQPAAPSAIPRTTTLSPASGASFDYIVTILMENNGYCDIITTSPCTTIGAGPYETRLASNYSLAGLCSSDSLCLKGGYTAITHPSEPNYCTLFGAEYANCATGDGTCCFQDPGLDLVDRLETAGLTWKAFAEDATNSTNCNFTPTSNSNHFPFLNFKDMNTPARCANLLTTKSPSDSAFLAVLNQPSGWPNYLWLTPTNDDNGHSSGAAAGDSYLSSLVPNILGSNLFTTQRAALFIVYDEGPTAYNYPEDYVYASWSGPAVKTNYVGSGSYSHYSYAKTLEVNWGLSPLTTNDAAANAMTEFFKSGTSPISTSFTFTPSSPQFGQTVSFAASVSGGISPYTYSWSFGDQSSGSGQDTSHAYTTPGSYNVLLTTSDATGKSATALQSLTVSASLTAGFNYSPSSPLTGLSTTFTAIASGGTPPYTYKWNFGDTATGSGSSVSHTFASTGSFVVSLNVNDSSSPQQTAAAHETIVVSNPSTTLATSFTFTPLLPQTNHTIIFTASATGGTSPYTYSWNFGDGSTTTGASVTHSYSSATMFIVVLTTTDSASRRAMATSEQSIMVFKPPPPLVASFVASPSTLVAGVSGNFAASVSGGMAPYSYQWSFGDGYSATGSSITHAYQTAGLYTVVLTVTDNSSPTQTTTSLQTVTVTASPPRVQPTGNQPPPSASLCLIGIIAGALVTVGAGSVFFSRRRRIQRFRSRTSSLFHLSRQSWSPMPRKVEFPI